jgi:hypothetical protein
MKINPAAHDLPQRCRIAAVRLTAMMGVVERHFRRCGCSDVWVLLRVLLRAGAGQRVQDRLRR